MLHRLIGGAAAKLDQRGVSGCGRPRESPGRIAALVALGADPVTGIGALEYRTPSSLFEDLVVCWRWTERITGTSSLPSPWDYREGFRSAPACRATGDAADPGRDQGRAIWCPSCPHDDDRLDLRLFWNPGRADNLTTTAGSGGDGYSFVGVVGYAFC
ncbi:MAG TPA: hypothetical protein VF062_18035 [Candidatus Limnocylindrales bacterium]